MKRLVSLILAATMLFGLAACGKKAPTWQEQYDLGMRYLSEGNYQEAILAFEAAITIDPKQADVYLSLAEAYVAAGDTEKAAAVLEQGLAETGNTSLAEQLEKLTPAETPAPMPAPTPAATPAPTPTPAATPEPTPEPTPAATPEPTSTPDLFAGDEVHLYEQLGALTYQNLPAWTAAPADGLGEYLPVQIEDYLINETVWYGSNDAGEFEVPALEYVYRKISGPGSAPVGAWSPVDSTGLWKVNFDNDNGENISLGWQNINMGDTVETVLTKLGLPLGLAEFRSIEVSLFPDGPVNFCSAYREASSSYNGLPYTSISIFYYYQPSPDFYDIEKYLTLSFHDNRTLTEVWYEDMVLSAALIGG